MNADPCVVIGMLVGALACLWITRQPWGARW